MIRSMTGFARGEAHTDAGAMTWELRAVNNRYLDINLRLPEDLRFLEPAVRERIGKQIKRGKVEAGLRFKASSTGTTELAVNTALAQQVISAAREIGEMAPNPAPLNVIDVMRWPGVVESTAPDPRMISAPALELLDTVVTDLVAAREREGNNIRDLIDTRNTEVEALAANLRERLPEVLVLMRERLNTRLAAIRDELDGGRLEQEMVIYAQKVDVAEELERLDSHVAEVRRLLDSPAPVGRQLDFLMQEMNREANTLGSKSADTESTRASVDLKVLVEQMREQIQNIE